MPNVLTTNPLTFQTLLDNCPISQNKMYYYFHSEKGDKNVSIYQSFMSSLEWMEEYQSSQKEGRFKNADYILFFVKTSNKKECVFIGLYKKNGVTVVTDENGQNPHDKYDLERCSELSQWSGRLFVEDPTTSLDIYNKAETIRDKGGLPILKLLTAKEASEFPGFHHFTTLVSELKNLPANYQRYLKQAKGVYLLTCLNSHKLYVGSAYGEHGFWGRWTGYDENAGGGNIALTDWIKKNEKECNFQVSLLEIAASTDSKESIIAKENSWKTKLNSRSVDGNGLNLN
jgi:hypothetical protein